MPLVLRIREVTMPDDTSDPKQQGQAQNEQKRVVETAESGSAGLPGQDGRPVDPAIAERNRKAMDEAAPQTTGRAGP